MVNRERSSWLARLPSIVETHSLPKHGKMNHRADQSESAVLSKEASPARR